MEKPKLEDLPVFGICGYSNSGKTTLIERLVPLLAARGLKAAVVKRTGHCIDVDSPGKDSDRFFRTGADVFFQSQNENFFRFHNEANTRLLSSLPAIARRYDIVLVEGNKNLPMAKVWLHAVDKSDKIPGIDGIIDVLPFGTDRVSKVMSILEEWLPKQWMKTPVYGCVLIGGDSTRMGEPKHLLSDNGKTWLETTAGLLGQVTDKVIIAGEGTIAESLLNSVRLPDVDCVRGPMAGILSAMRWKPTVSWLVTACDLPNLSTDALRWLLSTRRPGVWASLPELKGGRGIEPLLAHYDFRSHHLMEELAAGGIFRPGSIAENSKVIKVCPPDRLCSAWLNVNTKSELKSHRNSDGNNL